MNIDPARIEAAITPATSAILAVHVYGTPCNVEAIQAVADRHKLRLVYDAAHAFGVEIDGVGIGNFGDISMFSFHATKLFHSAEGGALAMRDPALKNEIDLLKNFGIRNENEVIMPGINGKMNEIQAVVGLAVLELVDEERKKRQTLAQTYRQRLGEVEGIRLLLPGSSISESMQYFVIRIDRNRFGRSRDEVHEAFRNHNVFTRKYFYPLCSEYACYSSLPSSSPANLPVAHTVVREVLCLPFYGGLTQDQVNDICDILLSLKR
jgi:dTDP-4-amino-4,6-dideoxygalactose transaminase